MTLRERFEKSVKRWEERKKIKFNGAEMARVCNISRQTINDWKHGHTVEIKSKHLFAAAKYLNVNAKWLESGRGSIEPDKDNQKKGIYIHYSLSL